MRAQKKGLYFVGIMLFSFLGAFGFQSLQEVPTKAATWKYVVLKADSNAKSEANQYYTHVANVKKVSNHYNVGLKVSYKKSLRLGAKAVKPISVGNEKVKPSTVKYGATKTTYTMAYSFNIKSTKTLKKIVKAKIHVAVPYMNISQVFGIRFKFTPAS